MSTLLGHQLPSLLPSALSRPGGVGSLLANAMKNQQQISLAELPIGVSATVVAVSQSTIDTDLAIIQRLVEIGFVPGEKVKVIAHGQPGREPIAVRIGGTTFALRRFEADYIYVVAEE
jgi:ferrous iron transport protein A